MRVSENRTENNKPSVLRETAGIVAGAANGYHLLHLASEALQNLSMIRRLQKQKLQCPNYYLKLTGMKY